MAAARVARSARSSSADRILAATTLAVVAAFFMFGATPVAVVVGIAFVLAGMPHGALDIALVRGSKPRFYASYVLAALLAVAAWLVHPLLSMALFLVGSALHFGESELAHLRLPGRWRAISYSSRGGLIVGVPSVAHSAEVVTFARELGLSFSTLAPATATVTTAALLLQHVLVLVALRRRRLLPSLGDELRIATVLGVAFVVLPPVLSIGLYLSTWHALAHGLAVFRQARRPFLRTWGIATALGLLGLAGAGLLWLLGGFALRSSSMLTALTIAVSALTLPHAITVARWHRRPRLT